MKISGDEKHTERNTLPAGRYSTQPYIHSWHSGETTVFTGSLLRGLLFFRVLVSKNQAVGVAFCPWRPFSFVFYLYFLLGFSSFQLLPVLFLATKCFSPLKAFLAPNPFSPASQQPEPCPDKIDWWYGV